MQVCIGGVRFRPASCSDRLASFLDGATLTRACTRTHIFFIFWGEGPKGLISVQPASNRPLESIQVLSLWAAIFLVLTLSMVVTINAYVLYLTYVGACAILQKPISRWKGRLMRGYLLVIFVLWPLRHIPYQVGRQGGALGGWMRLAPQSSNPHTPRTHTSLLLSLPHRSSPGAVRRSSATRATCTSTSRGYS